MMGVGEESQGDRDAEASSRIGNSEGELCKDKIVLFLRQIGEDDFVDLAHHSVVVVLFAWFDGSRCPSY